MAVTRHASEERQAAVLKFFLENPSATGEEAQRALTLGRLVGEKGQPPMGTGMLFRLQRQAHDMRRKSQLPPPLGGTPAQLDEAGVRLLRERALQLQELLAKAPGGVTEVHVSKDGVRVVRLRPTEEAL